MGPVPPVHTSITIYGTHFWIGPFLDHEKWRRKPHQLREFLHAAGGSSCGPDLPIHGSRDGMGKRFMVKTGDKQPIMGIYWVYNGISPI